MKNVEISSPAVRGRRYIDAACRGANAAAAPVGLPSSCGGQLWLGPAGDIPPYSRRAGRSGGGPSRPTLPCHTHRGAPISLLVGCLILPELPAAVVVCEARGDWWWSHKGWRQRGEARRAWGCTGVTACFTAHSARSKPPLSCSRTHHLARGAHRILHPVQPFTQTQPESAPSCRNQDDVPPLLFQQGEAEQVATPPAAFDSNFSEGGDHPSADCPAW